MTEDKDQVAKNAALKLSAEMQQDIVTWVLRSGLGKMYYIQRRSEPTGDEMCALSEIKFNTDDELHHDLAIRMSEWQARGSSTPSESQGENHQILFKYELDIDAFEVVCPRTDESAAVEGIEIERRLHFCPQCGEKIR